MSSTELEMKKRCQFLISGGFVAASIITLILGSYYSQRNISAIGLVLDMSGFLLVFGFGLPSRFVTNWDDNSRAAKKISWVGVILVLAGFLCQFMGYVRN